MPDLTLLDLVRNRTMSPAIASTLALAAEERRSLLNHRHPTSRREDDNDGGDARPRT